MITRIKQIIYQLYLKFQNELLLGKGITIDKHSYFEGKNALFNNVCLIRSHLGYGTYIANNSTIKGAKIGRFCAIGDYVRTGLGIHPTEKFVSIHPAFFSLQKQAGFTLTDKQLFEEHKYVDEYKRYYVEIGNDVWIGNNVLIMDGIKIGNGAVIAAGSIVTKDVDDYSVVGGVPSKLIKYRFSESQRKFLLEFKWWEKGIDWIKDNIYYFDDIEKFVNEFK